MKVVFIERDDTKIIVNSSNKEEKIIKSIYRFINTLLNIKERNLKNSVKNTIVIQYLIKCYVCQIAQKTLILIQIFYSI